MERFRFGRRNEGITRKLGRFVEDHVLDADIPDALMVLGVGAVVFLKLYLENRVAQLNLRIKKELGELAERKFSRH